MTDLENDKSDDRYGSGPGEGIWLVDRYYPLFNDCKNAAMDVAAMFGDKDTLEKLVAIQPLTVAES